MKTLTYQMTTFLSTKRAARPSEKFTSRTRQSRLHDPMLRPRLGMRGASDTNDESNLGNHGGTVAVYAAQTAEMHPWSEYVEHDLSLAINNSPLVSSATPC
jgi:hypothetical protein